MRTLIPAIEPDYAVAPGETLRERLDELGMTQADLARRIGLTAKHVSQVVRGAVPISADVAQRLELVVGTPAYWWLRLEADYQAATMRVGMRTVDAEQSMWLASMPVRALVKAGVLPAEPGDEGSRVRQLLAFFGVANVDSYRSLWARPVVAFRQSSAHDVDVAAVNVWLRQGELVAHSRSVGNLDLAALRSSLPHFRTLTRGRPADVLPSLVRAMAESGVALVFVPEVAGARAYGATQWVGSGTRRPVVQLSLRGRTDDQLWKTIFHELGHVLLHDRKQIFVDLEEGPGVLGEEDEPVDVAAGSSLLRTSAELEAERFAWDVLIPDTVQSDLATLLTEDDVLDFAERIGIGPSLVVARLQAERRWGFRQGNGLKRRVPPAVFDAVGGAPAAEPRAGLTARTGNGTADVTSNDSPGAVDKAAGAANPGQELGSRSAAEQSTTTERSRRRRAWHLPGEGP